MEKLKRGCIMKKKLALILAATIALSAAAGCSAGKASSSSSGAAPATSSKVASADTGASGAPVKFLVYACVSGGTSESGRQCTLAAETAQWYINEKLGGFPSLGGRPIQIEVLDSTSDAATATLPLERALSKGGYTSVIGNSNSSIALTMLPILEKYKVPTVTGAAANKAVSDQGCSFVFQPAATSSSFIPTQLDFLAEYAKHIGKDVKDLKLGLLYSNDAWGTDQSNNTRKQVSQRGLKLTSDEGYEGSSFTDATPLITKIRNAGVDVILPSAYPNDLKLIFTAMNTLNYHPLVVGGGAAITWPSLYKDLGDKVNGLTSVDSWCWDQKGAKENAGWMEMNAYYEKKNNEFLAGQSGPTLFSIMLAYEAVEKAKSDDPVKVRDELRKLNKDNSKWFGVINGNGDFDDTTGLNTNSHAIILQWQNGKPTSVYPPEYATGVLLNPNTMKPFA
jgi:branched-chain amino acid transport system substrate-binding protein